MPLVSCSSYLGVIADQRHGVLDRVGLLGRGARLQADGQGRADRLRPGRQRALVDLRDPEAFLRVPARVI